MRVIDPAWIGMKLRKLLNYAEPLGSFMAFVPGLPEWRTPPANLALHRGLPGPQLIIHRYALLGVLDESRLTPCATWACWTSPDSGG
jgi:ribonucleoside-diphosphate reductase alpha chain